MSQSNAATRSTAKKSRPKLENPDDEITPVSVGELSPDGATGTQRLPRSLLDPVRLALSVELGRAELTFRELQSLAQGAVVELDHMVGDPLEVRVNGYLIARGEVVAVKSEQHYGIRITEVVRHDSAGEA
jgi:flagellar motor switch protein FliN/FliY